MLANNLGHLTWHFCNLLVISICISYTWFLRARASTGSPLQAGSRCRTPPGADTLSQSGPLLLWLQSHHEARTTATNQNTGSSRRKGGEQKGAEWEKDRAQVSHRSDMWHIYTVSDGQCLTTATTINVSLYDLISLDWTGKEFGAQV